MAHPRMFDDDDPVLGRLRTVALAFPDAREKVSHGRPVFFTTKIFAHYGGTQKVAGEQVRHDQALLFRPEPDDVSALLDDRRFFVPAYVGAYGWLGIDLDDRVDWAEVAELVDASYRMTAPRSLVHELTRRSHPDSSW